MEPIKDTLGTVRYDKATDTFLVFVPSTVKNANGYWRVYIPQRSLLDEDVDKREVPAIGCLNLERARSILDE